MLQKHVGVPHCLVLRAVRSHSPEEHDLIIIGGGVAGYVGAIKAGQEGMKVCGVSCCGRVRLNE